MGSFRRVMSVAKRDGGEQNEGTTSGNSPSPKMFQPQSYFGIGRLLSAFFSSLGFLFVPGIFLQRTSRPLDRPKPKVHPWKKSFFHFSLCFMVGIFVGFTPFVSVDISQNLMLKHQALSFAVDSTAGNALPQIDRVLPVIDMPESVDDLDLNVTLKQLLIDGDSIHDIPATSQNLVSADQKLLIIVTPTYARPFQAYHLNRLAQILRSAPPPLLWIVVEMSQQSPETAELLRETGVMYRHLVCQKNITDVKYRAVHQRNVALSHIEKHQLDGIVHFANDDSIYSPDIFEQMREIRRFGTWPVVVFAEKMDETVLEGPVCNGTIVVGWHINGEIMMSRRFHADISGFAFNSTILWDSKSWYRPMKDLIRQLDNVKKEFQVSTFIEQLVEDESQMEGLPDGCSKIMAWRLNLEAPSLLYPQGWSIQRNLEAVILSTWKPSM